MRRDVAVAYRWLAVACIGIVLAGCSSSDDGSNERPSLDQIAADAKARGHEWQAEVLSDGDITLAEYDEAHRRTLQCLDAAGIQYSEPERSIINGYDWLFDMYWPSMDDSEGQQVSSACSEENKHEVELAMSAWGDWETDPALLADVLDCVSSKGFEVDRTVKTLRDVWLYGSDQGLSKETVAGCARIGMQRLYPGVGYGLGI